VGVLSPWQFMAFQYRLTAPAPTNGAPALTILR
jgi:hypothetical protein